MFIEHIRDNLNRENMERINGTQYKVVNNKYKYKNVTLFIV